MPPDDTDPSPKVQNATGGDKTGDQPDINAIINAAVSSQLKRALPKAFEGIGATVKTEIETALAPLREQIASATRSPEQPDAKGGKTKRGDDAPPEPDPKVVALEQKIAKLEADNKAANERAARERRQAIEEKGYGHLRQELTGKVRPEALGAVVDILRARNQVVIDDEGRVALKFRASIEKGLPEEDHELPLAEALPHYLKTKEAALFVPPPTQGGAGAKGRSTPARAGGPQPQRLAMPGATPSVIETFEAEHGSIDELL